MLNAWLQKKTEQSSLWNKAIGKNNTDKKYCKLHIYFFLKQQFSRKRKYECLKCIQDNDDDDEEEKQFYFHVVK